MALKFQHMCLSSLAMISPDLRIAHDSLGKYRPQLKRSYSEKPHGDEILELFLGAFLRKHHHTFLHFKLPSLLVMYHKYVSRFIIP